MIKTNYINNSEDYLRKRLAGENVTSVATLYGINAITVRKTSEKFTVLVVNINDYSFFRYEVNQDRFRVSDFKESTPHSLADVVSPIMLKNEKMLKWWNCVFFERDGKRFYDSVYDDLHVADETYITFKDVIKGFDSALSELLLSILSYPVFLTGDLAENPLLQYVLQQQFSMKEIMVLTCKEKENLYVNENDIVALPESQLNKLKLNTNTTISLASIVSNPLRVILPLDSSIRSVMVSNLKWEDVLIDSQNDYCLKDLGFKTVSLSVECDSFQNIFLSCVDLNSNCKVLQVK